MVHCNGVCERTRCDSLDSAIDFIVNTLDRRAQKFSTIQAHRKKLGLPTAANGPLLSFEAPAKAPDGAPLPRAAKPRRAALASGLADALARCRGNAELRAAIESMLNDGNLRPSHRGSLVTALRIVQQRLVDDALHTAAGASSGANKESKKATEFASLAPSEEHVRSLQNNHLTHVSSPDNVASTSHVA